MDAGRSNVAPMSYETILPRKDHPAMKSYSGSLLMNEEFFGVMDLVGQIITLFSSGEMLKSTHSELEQAVVAKGREFCKALIQANLTGGAFPKRGSLFAQRLPARSPPNRQRCRP